MSHVNRTVFRRWDYIVSVRSTNEELLFALTARPLFQNWQLELIEREVVKRVKDGRIAPPLPTAVAQLLMEDMSNDA